MEETTPSAQPTAARLKQELSESLQILRTDFEGLKHFVAELSAEGVSPPVTLTKDDLGDLLSVTLEIHDAASDIRRVPASVPPFNCRFQVPAFT